MSSTGRQSTKPILVGYDASEHARRALQWAAGEAAAHGVPLLVLTAVQVPYGSWGQSGRVYGQEVAEGRRRAAQVLEGARGRVVASAPGVEVETRVVLDGAVHAILRAAEEAQMLVLGARGLSYGVRLLVGSVSLHVAMHAPVPTVVVRGHGGSGAVVVGMDGSPAAVAALELGMSEAGTHGCPLEVVRARPAYALDPGILPRVDTAAAHEDERLALSLLQEEVAPWQDKHPEVDVRLRSPLAHPLDALVEASTGARLLVLGTRGRNTFERILLGSTSVSALGRADCPVAVVPAPARWRM